MGTFTFERLEKKMGKQMLNGMEGVVETCFDMVERLVTQRGLQEDRMIDSLIGKGLLTRRLTFLDILGLM
jgi:hypothetical protein